MRTRLESPKLPATIGMSTVGARLPNRDIVRNVVVALTLVLSAAGVWLTLTGIGAAYLDLAVAKWIHFNSLLVLIGGGAWAVLAAGRGHNAPGINTLIAGCVRYGKFVDLLEYALATLLLSGIYVLVGYTIHFGSRFGPWYNGLIGTQGLFLLLLASVVFVRKMEPEAKSRGLLLATTITSVCILALSVVFDIVPHLS